MIVLTSTFTLELILSAGTADVDVSYVDRTATAYPIGATQQTAATATTQTICSAPAASTSREIDFLSVKIKTTGGVVTIQKLNSSGAVVTQLISVTLLDEEVLTYTHGSGWAALDANGNRKEVTSTVLPSLTVTGNATVGVTLGVTGATTLSAALTYGGVTLSNAVTGTGNMVLSASPTLTGTVTGATINATNFNGILGATTPAAASVTTLAASGLITGRTAASNVFAFSSANAGWNFGTWYKADGSTALGYLGGGGGSAVSGGTVNDFAVRSEGDLLLAAGGDAVKATLSSTGLAITGTLGVTTGAAVGGATPGTGGVAFPATAVAVADANTLDDYEEGTFTPTITFGGASVGITYNATFTGATYTKVGKRVFVSGYVLLTNKGSSTGSASVANLPFTSETGNKKYLSATVSLGEVTFANQYSANIAPNTAELSLFEATEAGVVTQLTDANFGNTSYVYFSAHFTV